MKKGIVFKLFVLTTALCILILATIFFGQTVFFKQYYVHQKVENVKASLETFAQNYVNQDNHTVEIRRLEQEFYREHNTWVTVLDQFGNIKESNDDSSIEVEIKGVRGGDFAAKTITIPLYSFDNFKGIRQGNEFLRNGNDAVIQVLRKGTEVIPYRMSTDNFTLTWENNQIANKEHELLPNGKRSEEDWNNEKFPTLYLSGTITKTTLPAKNETTRFIYTNNLFLDRIRAFQAELLLNNVEEASATLEGTYEENDIKYKQFVMAIKDKEGKDAYLFAMTSLQPVDEAIQMIQDYYLYIIVFVLVLILLASFYFSKGIARPLLRINHMTKKITELDFTEKLPITSKDEIGDLSRNINELSDRLHSYIQKLQHDIEKEKQLEHTRKEFISGVSHELKTPLSVIQSCLSILKDGVANHKKDYYFAAMESEVKRMDLLIVDMLKLAKYESGTYKIQLDTFRIDTVIDETCKKLAAEIAKKQLNLHVSLAPVEVLANQLLIGQVIVNFINNAIRYTPEGNSIHISINEKQESVKVCIENTGVHIPAEQIEKIWDRFYRGEASRHRSTGGTGLGLAISKKILELHEVPYGAKNTTDGVLFFFHLKKSNF
ncbi:sensor histidine kinase [Paenibacillus apiarius]|uniref:histidine kinase n=1 Tax=Paenibacillus apiarius TaxID=46240 RepID=A0ABT4DXP4_9BACL|nr:HAMP domain-containing sensor histidine kinase [Paenibacillus apiarius]MCY9517614.1 ATP-binding protein [Paenibacillus apiarius]MCY9522126.1 ATP-binding protein [Paenibacillus apiarius]MCY9552585.1 ATP-binding protein [Paenibacillus apiarius]MCY9559234.1 ATP-binding protein [Paenibacillus apiarius]MCY9683657.1 ATP-binding protein [Paenibacillus apiarius]